MNVHELKTWPDSFRRIQGGSKRWELRRNDRDFEQGDLLWLREWETQNIVVPEEKPPHYTGESVIVQVWKVYHDFDVPEGLRNGFVIMDIRRVNVTPVYES